MLDLRYRGFYVVEKALDNETIGKAKEACTNAQAKFREEVGEDRLKRSMERGVVRAPMKYDRFFYDLLSFKPLLEAVDFFIGEHAILHLQNAFVLPPHQGETTFQTTLHRDFPRYLNGYVASLNVYFALSRFTEQNGALKVLPGSHQFDRDCSKYYLDKYSEPVLCDAGAMIVFDSTLWHCAGLNNSREDRISINHQFTKPFLKPQFDYVRLLGEEEVLSVPPRTQKLLGYHARVPASLDEYYRPESERVYRKGQG